MLRLSHMHIIVSCYYPLAQQKNEFQVIVIKYLLLIQQSGNVPIGVRGNLIGSSVVTIVSYGVQVYVIGSAVVIINEVANILVVAIYVIDSTNVLSKVVGAGVFAQVIQGSIAAVVNFIGLFVVQVVAVVVVVVVT
ncbi:UNKNOWN [Stylonychia lemnae]|uniref:Uncharacterized protein n=1 Tax=Stylonychia lemnae TaxID=5949 RepID=A0A078AWP4_STYLE|nr:UNKNOWN [Stylonychia lemnae]|eukprot:CDW86584.1 UNKNOWN [Stylonychia lemnae]